LGEQASNGPASDLLDASMHDRAEKQTSMTYKRRRTQWMESQPIADEVVTSMAQSRVTQEAVDEKALNLARAAFTKVSQQEVANFASQEGIALGTARQALVAQRQKTFGNGGVDIEKLINTEKPAARVLLLKEAKDRARLEEQQKFETIFDESYKAKFEILYHWAYQLALAREGPLEEAAEWDRFCNADRADGDSEKQKNVDSEEQKVDDSGSDDAEEAAAPGGGDNAWCLDGYGGLIETYGRHLEQAYDKLLQIMLKTPVSKIKYGEGFPQLCITTDGQEKTVIASAVIVTVSTGVINARRLALDGPGKEEVLQKYALLPMGNYKKVVLVFDREVALPEVPDKQGDTNTHRGTSVYWCLDEEGKLWKFLVPDVNRTIVITIVGGRLADELDGVSKDECADRAQAMLRKNGLITEGALIREIHISTWKQDPEFEGAYSYTAPGGQGARKYLREQPLMEHCVALAGEALHENYGTAHGAYVTGLRAAGAVGIKLPQKGVVADAMAFPSS
jgi:hypothetical protein